MSDKIERAKLLAQFVHLGQKRQDGEDYIEHCFRVAQGMGYVVGYKKENEDIICVALLHDVLEDCDQNCLGDMHRIISQYFGDDVYNIVCILTNHGWKSYNEYINNIIDLSPQALQIKWVDMIDNTSYKASQKQWNKYRDACIFLQGKGVEIPAILKERLKI